MPHFQTSAPEPTAAFLRLSTIVAGRTHLLNYAYLVFNPIDRDAILIDPGWEPDFIQQVIADKKLRLRGIFITHSHKDHWQAAPELARALDCPLYISRHEACASGITDASWRLFDHADAFIFGHIKIQCLLTPGHTIGSTCFLSGGYFFTGDTLFMEGCGLCAEPGGSDNDIFDTMQFLKTVTPLNVRIFPGHQYRSPIGLPFSELMRSNIYLRIQNRAEFFKFCQRKARQLYKPPPIDSKPLDPPRLIDFGDDETAYDPITLIQMRRSSISAPLAYDEQRPAGITA